MRAIACVVLAFAFAGCASEDDLAIRRCAREIYIPAWNDCIERYNAKVSARKVREEQQGSEDAAAWGLLGATAVMNGYNQSRPAPMITCFNYGMMTQCQ